jgi:hypothetical protein
LYLDPTYDYNRHMESKIIKNDKFRKIASNIKPDSKKRVVLSQATMIEDITYHVYCNEIGQIILDPQISIPASEIWLYKNPEARESLAIGLQEASEGKVTKVNLDEL